VTVNSHETALAAALCLLAWLWVPLLSALGREEVVTARGDRSHVHLTTREEMLRFEAGPVPFPTSACPLCRLLGTASLSCVWPALAWPLPSLSLAPIFPFTCKDSTTTMFSPPPPPPPQPPASGTGVALPGRPSCPHSRWSRGQICSQQGHQGVCPGSPGLRSQLPEVGLGCWSSFLTQTHDLCSVSHQLARRCLLRFAEMPKPPGCHC
jgi:hypothetical protein